MSVHKQSRNGQKKPRWEIFCKIRRGISANRRPILDYSNYPHPFILCGSSHGLCRCFLDFQLELLPASCSRWILVCQCFYSDWVGNCHPVYSRAERRVRRRGVQTQKCGVWGAQRFCTCVGTWHCHIWISQIWGPSSLQSHQMPL